MNFQSTHYYIILALTLGFFTSLPSFASEADEKKPIVVINTFEVQGGAENFLVMMDKAREIAKKLNPKGQGKTRILSGNIGGEYSHLITVATTYPNMEAYSQAYEFYDGNPELEAVRVKMDKAGYQVIHRSINTVIAEY